MAMIKDQIDELMRENGIVIVGEAVYALCNLVEEQSAAAEQEPVAWQFMYGSNFRKRRPDDFADLNSDGLPYWKPLFTVPPQREWVGLTNEDKKQIEIEANNKSEMTAWEYAQRVGNFTEAKLKEKNT